MKELEFDKLLTCFHTCLKLKNVLRTSFVDKSKKRKESVAEHSWMLALMVILISPYLKSSFCLSKALKIALIHDIGESLIGDANLIDLLKNDKLRTERFEEEEKALTQIFNALEEKEKNELLSLWHDFEKRDSYEAKVVSALDKIEAQIQQNNSNEKTLDELKRLGLLSKLDGFFGFDEFIEGLKNNVLKEYEENKYEY